MSIYQTLTRVAIGKVSGYARLGSKGKFFLWFAGVHARNHILKLCKNIMPPPSHATQTISLKKYAIKAIKYLIGKKITKTVSYHLNLHSV